MRLDVYLVEHGYVESRERAKRLILSGAVILNGKTASKPALDVEGEPLIAVEQESFVGRGGEKLEAALRAFSVDPKGLCALDIGASTGGFTHCLLLHGASSVTALDAGCGQLHPMLRADPRVTNIEKYNARELSARDVGCFQLIVMDVSFISQTYILPKLPPLLLPHGRAITLIKPQFEAGRDALNKKGIVTSPRDRISAIRRVMSCAREVGFLPIGLCPSPILGGDGNEEYLACFALEGEDRVSEQWIEKTVRRG